MAGKTRPGFFGSDEAPASNPDDEASPRAARTIIGRALHLRPQPQPLPVASAPPGRREPTPAAVPKTAPEEVTERVNLRPRHTGKSKFPAIARLFGRWTTGGGFLSRSRMSGIDADPLTVPREAWPSRVAVFVVAALLSFCVALAVLRVRQCGTSTPPPTAATQAPAAAPAPPPAVAPEPVASPVPAEPAVPLDLGTQTSTAAVPVADAGQPERPKTRHRSAASGHSATSGATGRSRTQSARPDPRPPGDPYRDTLLPLRM
jgi:hypothetical protein